jgi:hypothetical protein
MFKFLYVGLVLFEIPRSLKPNQVFFACNKDSSFFRFRLNGIFEDSADLIIFVAFPFPKPTV